jgi:Cytochrome c554 and c-prime
MVSPNITALARRALTGALALACVTSYALADEPAKFVGGQVCSGCHAAETESWRGSHHALAMQKATETTVLGDFANAPFEHLGVVTTFSRSGDKFMVNTEGPDGALRDYEIAYTFGI